MQTGMQQESADGRRNVCRCPQMKFKTQDWFSHWKRKREISRRCSLLLPTFQYQTWQQLESEMENLQEEKHENVSSFVQQLTERNVIHPLPSASLNVQHVSHVSKTSRWSISPREEVNESVRRGGEGFSIQGLPRRRQPLLLMWEDVTRPEETSPQPPPITGVSLYQWDD